MSLRLVVGPMFAGKTTEIQAVIKRYKFVGRQVLVIKPAMDNRYSGDSAIVSHDQVSLEAISVHALKDALELAEFKTASVIAIDEAQFFTGLREFIETSIELGKDVIVVGLDGDAEGRPFTEVLELVAIADSVDKKTALCVHCGSPAMFTCSLKKRENRLEVGGADMYEPTCRKHRHGHTKS
jgi:thymidine kinase